MNQKTNKIQFELINNEITEFIKQDEAHLNLIYTPDTSKLTIGGDLKGVSDFRVIGEYPCSTETFAKILTWVINSPLFITGNTQRPANISIEYGNYR